MSENEKIIAGIIQAQIGTREQADIIQEHMKEYFTRWHTYKDKFTELEWYHIFLDFLEKIPQSPSPHLDAVEGRGKMPRWMKSNEIPDHDDLYHCEVEIDRWSDGSEKTTTKDTVRFAGGKWLCEFDNWKVIRWVKETEAPAAQPVEKGFTWTNDMVRSFVKYCEIGDCNKCTDENMNWFKRVYAEDHPNLMPRSETPASGEDHVHVQLPSGGMATVSPNASPELLRALDEIVELAKKMPDKESLQETTTEPVPIQQGEVPEEIVDWIKEWCVMNGAAAYWTGVPGKIALAMYHKMQQTLSDLTADRDQYKQWYERSQASIASLTSQLEAVQKENADYKLGLEYFSKQSGISIDTLISSAKKKYPKQ